MGIATEGPELSAVNFERFKKKKWKNCALIYIFLEFCSELSFIIIIKKFRFLGGGLKLKKFRFLGGIPGPSV